MQFAIILTSSETQSFLDGDPQILADIEQCQTQIKRGIHSVLEGTPAQTYIAVLGKDSDTEPLYDLEIP